MKYPTVAWSAEIEVGLPLIDAQHKRLFDLAASFAGEGDQIRVMKTLVELCDYAKVHLREEEAMLAAIGYPGLVEHKRHHARFRRMLNELLEDARGMTLDEIAERVEALINGWFCHHIMKVDAEYVPAVAAHAARTALAGTDAHESPPSPA
jgi:hemerythrin